MNTAEFNASIFSENTEDIDLTQCGQVFKPTQELERFLEKTAIEIEMADQQAAGHCSTSQCQPTHTTDQTSHSTTNTAKVAIKRNITQAQQNLELQCTGPIPINKQQKKQPKRPMNSEIQTTMPTEEDKIRQRTTELLALPFTRIGQYAKMQFSQSIKESTKFFELMEIIYGIHPDTDPVFYPITIVILMMAVFTATTDIQATLHPQKWMTCIPELATAMEDMVTTEYENVIQKYTNTLTTLRQSIRTSYESLPISSLISIGRGTTSTCPTLLCRLDAMELFNVLKSCVNTSDTSSIKSSSSSVNMTTTSTSPTCASRQRTLAVAPSSSE
ncbi:Hypothetical protein CINCED_3A011658, partial [Cinara cedri]